MTKLVPLDEAAAEVGVHRTTIFRYLKRGFLKRYKAKGVDKRTFVDIEALRDLLRNPPLKEVDS